MTKDEDPLIGKIVLGRYRIVRPLARGGMGVVYLARLEGAAGFSKPVVIKQVLAHLDGYADARAQFIREARILSELHHPGIVGVLDFGEEADAYVMALEYVHGYHLGQWARYLKRTSEQMDPEIAAYIVLRILESLSYAHTRIDQAGASRAIIHRDISPGNILIDQQGNVRLLDFGIARAVGDQGEFKTQDGVVKGKLSYLAPEIYASVEANQQTDVYAVGVILYQLLSGANPFVGRDMNETVARVLKGNIPPISSKRPDLSPEYVKVVTRAMAPNPKDRFESAAGFAAAMDAVLERPQSDVANDFRAAIEADFSGDLPDVLGLPRLSELDAAWRKSGKMPGSEPSLLRSSLPPGDKRAIERVQVPPLGMVHDALPNDPNSPLMGGGLEPLNPPQRPNTAGGWNEEGTNGQGGGAQSNKRVLVLAVVGAAVVAAAVATVVSSLSKPQSSSGNQQRYLLVERSGTSSPVARAKDTSGDNAHVKTTPEGAHDSLAVGSGGRLMRGGPQPKAAQPVNHLQKTGPHLEKAHGASALTKAFGRQAAQVQACFTKNAGALQGAPQVSVRFQIAASGKVKSATLVPASLASTSVGGCLLSVARKTNFPSVENDMTFSIPITARVVKD